MKLFAEKLVEIILCNTSVATNVQKRKPKIYLKWLPLQAQHAKPVRCLYHRYTEQLSCYACQAFHSQSKMLEMIT